MIRFLALLFPCALFASDWPEFLGPTRDNISAETGLRETFSSKGLPLLWEKKVGSGYAAPSVRGELLVLHHRVGNEEIVEAFDAKTGASRWKHAYPSRFIDPFGFGSGPRCSPLLTEERCYTFGAEGVLLCLELATGKLIWRRDTAKEFEVPEAFFGVGSSPVLEEGVLIVMVGGQPNSGVVGFDALTGRTLWENVGEKTWTGVPMTGWPGERLVQWNSADPAFQKQASYCTPVLATIHGKRHVLCVMRQGLVSLDPRSGAHRFSFWFRARQDSSVNAMTPIVEGDRILISSAYYKNGSVLLRVNPEGNGVSELWRGLQLEMHWSRPILKEGFLYAFSGRNEPDGRFRCVEFATGTVRWDRPEGWPNAGHSRLREGDVPPNVFGRASAILADDKLIALGESGLLGIFRPNPEKLEELARWQVPHFAYPCWVGPVLAHKRLYLRDDERMVCYDLGR
ncbi:MAG: PQQ-binding-like beta-propeller repeat protein [Verrucomicrobiota bacterium]